MTSPLSNLQIDAWYKGVIVVAAAVLIGSLAFQTPHITILALGFLFIGFGEWINHPRRQGIIPGYIVTSTARAPSAFGWSVNVVGAALILIGIIRTIL
jgi:hypothetical protein